MSNKLQETELKFLLTAQAAERFRSNLLEGALEDQLTSTYYDTPGRDLMRAGATLRLRRTRTAWLQTLKSGGGPSIARFEDERPAKDGRLDPHLFSRRTYRRLGAARPSNLQPLFETRVTRRTILLDHRSASIEVALDHGDILAGPRRAPIEELELELKSGELPELFCAARDFAQMDGVCVSLISKSERGHRLSSGNAAASVKFRPPILDRKASFREGFQTLVMAALHQLSANADILRDTASLGAVHQARVALRRLRTFVGASKSIKSDSQFQDVKDALKRLTAVFEEARALDVFQADTFLPLVHHDAGGAEFGAALLAAKTRAYAGVEAAVRRNEFAKDLYYLVEWTFCGSWTLTSAKVSEEDTLGAVADRLMAHRWRALRRLGRNLDWSDTQARHTLRIQAKKMRYLMEALAPGGRGRKGFLLRLKGLQDQLGVLNDIATASDTAKLAFFNVSAEAAFVAGSIIGERRAEAPIRVEAVKKAFARLLKQDVVWG